MVPNAAPIAPIAPEIEPPARGDAVVLGNVTNVSGGGFLEGGFLFGHLLRQVIQAAFHPRHVLLCQPDSSAARQSFP